MRQPRVQHPRAVSSQYLLSGLLHCGKCGSAMSGCWAKSGKYFYYCCVKHQKMGKEICDCHSISKEKIENFIVERLKENVLTEENIKQLVHLSAEEFSKDSRHFESQFNEIGQQLAQAQGRLTKLYSALESGKVDLEDLAPRIKEVRTQQKELEDKRNQLLDEMNEGSPINLGLDRIREYVDSLKTLLESSSFIEQKTFLKSFIKRIELNEPQVVIDYTMPLPINGLTATEEVLRIDRIGSPTRIRT